MNNALSYNQSDLSIILEQLKSTKYITQDSAAKQICMFINQHRETPDDIIKKIAMFFNNNYSSIPDSLFIKVITNVLKVLIENNVPITNFMNEIFYTLMHIIFHENRTPEHYDLIIQTIGNLISKCGTHASQIIESHVNSIFARFKNEQNFKYEYSKYALISLLKEFVRNSSVIAYNKIIESFDDFMEILTNFKNSKDFIRHATMELIREFLLLLSNRDFKIREEFTKKIFDIIDKDLRSNNSDANVVHGIILVLKACTVRREFFNEKYKIAMDYLNKNKKHKSTQVRLLIIEVIPYFAEYLKEVFEDEYLQTFCSFFLTLFLEKPSNEIKNQLLIAFGKLSLIVSTKKFESYAIKIIKQLKIDIEKNQIGNFCVNGLDCLACFIKNFKECTITEIPGDFLFDKMFNCGFNESHIVYLKQLLMIYDQNSPEMIKILFIVLNVISIIVSDRKFYFRNTQKKFKMMSFEFTESNGDKYTYKDDSSEGVKNQQSQSLSIKPTAPLSSSALTSSIIPSGGNDDEQKKLINLNIQNKEMTNAMKSILSYIYNAKSNAKGDFMKIMSSLLKNALIFLKDISHPLFAKDILFFYQHHCIKLLESSDFQTKRIIIQLATSKWIPNNELCDTAGSLDSSSFPNDSDNLNNTSNSIIRQSNSASMYPVDSDTEYLLNIILDAFLNLILSEPNDELKILMLENLDERYDRLLAENRFFNKLTFILNFNEHLIRENAIKIISRIINLNYTTVILFVKKSILEIFVTLEISQNLFEKENAIVLLSYFVKYTGVNIIDYIEQIFSTLIKILKAESQLGDEVTHSNDMLNISILSIVSDLISNSYEKKVQTDVYYKDILLICIGNLKENSSVFKQEISLRTILSILENSDKDWKIYFDFIELVASLIQILIRTTNKNSRVFALKIFGFIGAMDPDKLEFLRSIHKINTEDNSNEFYEVEEFNNFDDGYFMHNNRELIKKSILPIEQGGESKTEKKKTFDFLKFVNQSKLDTCTYQAVYSLMNILNDNTQQELSNKVIVHLKDLLKNLNGNDNSIINLILPTLINIIGNFEINIRTIILDYLYEIIIKYKVETRQFIPELVSILTKYIIEKDYQEKIMKILIKMLEIYLDDMEPFFSRIVPLLLLLLHDKDLNENDNQILLLRRTIFSALELMSSKLANYLHLILPETLNILNSSMNERKLLTKSAPGIEENVQQNKKSEDFILKFIDSILILPNFAQQMPKIITVLLKYIEINPSKGDYIMSIFMKMLNAFRKEFLTFLPVVIRYAKANGVSILKYFREMKVSLEKEEIVNYIEINRIKKSAGATNKKAVFNNNEYDDTNQQGTNSLIKMNPDILLNEFNPVNCSIEEDWYEWFKSSSKSLFFQSPSYALRCCQSVSNYYPPLLNELYNYAFISVWKTLTNEQKETIKLYLNMALEASKTPTEILLTILNLAEFIEREENHIEFISFDKLGQVADVCKAYAKALYYVENDFRNNNDYSLLEKLITLYYDLELPESAIGILEMARINNQALNEEDCYLKLHKWKEALDVINKKKKSNDKGNKDLEKTEFICLDGLSDWEKLLSLGNDLEQSKKNDDIVNKMSPALAKASLNLGEWDKLQHYINIMEPEEDEEIYEKNFFQAVLSIKAGNYQNAKNYIENARNAIDDKIKTLLSESYQRAYKLFLANEHLYELEEIIELQSGNKRLKKEKLKQQWDSRLEILDRDIKTYERMLSIRGLVFNLDEDYEPHLDLAKICRREDRFTTCMIVLNRLKKRLEHCGRNVSLNIDLSINKCLFENSIKEDSDKAIRNLKAIIDSEINNVDDTLKSKTYCYYAQWIMEKEDKALNGVVVKDILKYLELSTKYNNKNYKAWHCYGLLNYKFFETIFSETKGSPQREDRGSLSKQIENLPSNAVINDEFFSFASNAIRGFTTSVCIGGKSISKTLQDLLRLIDIWFQVGSNTNLNELIQSSFQQIQLESWLLVIPQLLARVGVNNEKIRNSLVQLLKQIGIAHPSSLNYPLIVMKKTKSQIRSMAAGEILNEMGKVHDKLINECDLIIGELNRCAMLLHEEWREAIDESAKLLFQTKDIHEMIKVLMNVHVKMDCDPVTMNEVHFHQMFRGELTEAKNLLNDYIQYKNEIDIKNAWEIYYHLFLSMKENFPELKFLDLENVSPKLSNFKQSEISVPGMYKSGFPLVKISGFEKQLTVLNSKQHPRKIIIYGSDGKDYMFLLKGHEDLRQDERAMQLFGLVNTLLSNDPDTSEKNLFIKRFSVIPLSHNTGIIGWVPNCDTINQLIKEYRATNKIHINVELRLMQSIYPKFEFATFMTKLEVFTNVMKRTLGLDLYKILWKKSKNSETWLDRRSNYSRSLAVMSMVGYILGLGDRHTSNLMLDRKSGKILHIDFGDCFEVAMKREKYPEKIPFRLTRMLIKALEVSGIEGTFRITCENVMKVLRANKDSLIALLTAFVHDPLISFRLLIPLILKANKTKKATNVIPSQADTAKEIETNKEGRDEIEYEKKRIGSAERQLYNQFEEKEEIESDELNKIAKLVLERIIDKLQGTEFIKEQTLTIEKQVEKLIKQATSEENLSQSYLGWCPFW